MIIMTVIPRQYLPNNNDDQILHRYDLFAQGPAKCHKTLPRNKYGGVPVPGEVKGKRHFR